MEKITLIQKKLSEIKKLTENFLKIKVNEKPYFDNGKIELNDNSYLSSITRYLTSQSREYFLENFQDLMGKLKVIINNLAEFNKNRTFFLIYYTIYQELKNEITSFIMKMVNSLETMKMTYQTDEEYVKKLDKEIEKLLKFKNLINLTNGINQDD